MRSDAPTQRGGVTNPNEFDVFRRRREHEVRQERGRQMAIRILEGLIALTLAAIAALVLQMIFF
jgi:hypothetical protein